MVYVNHLDFWQTKRQVDQKIIFMFLNYICLQGEPDPLNSAFHLTYNMVLNLLRVEEINPEYMLERSFYQFQNYAAIPGLCESKNKSSQKFA